MNNVLSLVQLMDSTNNLDEAFDFCFDYVISEGIHTDDLVILNDYPGSTGVEYGIDDLAMAYDNFKLMQAL